MADPTGFEPAISSVTGWHVGPLHHGSVRRVRRIAGGGPVVAPSSGPCRAAAGSTWPPILAADEPHRPPLRHRHQAHRRDAPGDGRPPRSATTSSATTRPSIALEERAAELLGKEAGLFVASGDHGQPRRPARPSRPRPGDDRRRRAATSSWTRRPATRSSSGRASGRSRSDPDGTIDPADDPRRVPRSERRPRADHRAGRDREHPRPLDGPAADRRPTPREVAAVAHEHGVPLHVDGARFFNAVVAQGVSPTDAGRPGRQRHVLPAQGPGLPGRLGRRRVAATSSGAPAAGASSSAAGCARWASSRRPGSSPCATDPAGMIERLAEDHANARRLAEGLAEHATASCRPAASPSRRPARSTRTRPHELRRVQGGARPRRVPRRPPCAGRADGRIPPRSGPRGHPPRRSTAADIETTLAAVDRRICAETACQRPRGDATDDRSPGPGRPGRTT